MAATEFAQHTTATTTVPATVQLTDVSKTYGRGDHLVAASREFSLALAPGSYTAVMTRTLRRGPRARGFCAGFSASHASLGVPASEPRPRRRKGPP